MATLTHRVATPSTANATSYASGSFTPAVGDLLVAGVVVAGTTTPFPTMTNSAGIAFRFIGVALLTASVDRLYLFVARTLVASATSQTVTFDCTGDAATGATILVASVAGMTRTADNGAVRQYKVASNVAAGTPTVTFGNAVLTGNPTLGFVGNATNPAGLTAPTGWTEPAGGDTGFATPASGAEYVYRDSGFTGTAVTWGSASASAYGALVVELDTSAYPTNDITLVGTPTLNASATARTSTVLTSPSGSQADDVAVIAIQHSTGSANGTQTAPDGTWTLIDTQRGSGLTAWAFLYAKKLTGPADATYTFTHPSTVTTGAMLILRGVDPTTMLDRTVQAGDLVSDTLTPYPVPVITTATNNALALALFSGAATASGFITEWPLDYEEVIFYSDALTTCKMAVHMKQIATAGSTPAVQYATISDKDMLVGQFAFKPAVTGTPASFNLSTHTQDQSLGAVSATGTASRDLAPHTQGQLQGAVTPSVSVTVNLSSFVQSQQMGSVAAAGSASRALSAHGQTQAQGAVTPSGSASTTLQPHTQGQIQGAVSAHGGGQDASFDLAAHTIVQVQGTPTAQGSALRALSPHVQDQSLGDVVPVGEGPISFDLSPFVQSQVLGSVTPSVTATHALSGLIQVQLLGPVAASGGAEIVLAPHAQGQSLGAVTGQGSALYSLSPHQQNQALGDVIAASADDANVMLPGFIQAQQMGIVEAAGSASHGLLPHVQAQVLGAVGAAADVVYNLAAFVQVQVLGHAQAIVGRVRPPPIWIETVTRALDRISSGSTPPLGRVDSHTTEPLDVTDE